MSVEIKSKISDTNTKINQLNNDQDHSADSHLQSLKLNKYPC